MKPCVFGLLILFFGAYFAELSSRFILVELDSTAERGVGDHSGISASKSIIIKYDISLLICDSSFVVCK